MPGGRKLRSSIGALCTFSSDDVGRLRWVELAVKLVEERLDSGKGSELVDELLDLWLWMWVAVEERSGGGWWSIYML